MKAATTVMQRNSRLHTPATPIHGVDAVRARRCYVMAMRLYDRQVFAIMTRGQFAVK